MDIEIPYLSGYLNVPTQSGFSLKKKSTQRYCLLFKASRHGIERLEICESKDDKNPKIITLENCVKITHDSATNVIQIVKKTGTLTLNTLTEIDLCEWVTALQTVAFNNNNKNFLLNNTSVGGGGTSTTATTSTGVQMSSTTGITSQSSSSSSIIVEEDNDLYCSSYGDDGIFLVKLIPSPTSIKCNFDVKNYILHLTTIDIQLKLLDDINTIIAKWPYKFIRKYGYSDGKFTFEAGRKCKTGEGIFTFSHSNSIEIFRCMSSKTKSMKKLLNNNNGIISQNCNNNNNVSDNLMNNCSNLINCNLNHGSNSNLNNSNSCNNSSLFCNIDFINNDKDVSSNGNSNNNSTNTSNQLLNAVLLTMNAGSRSPIPPQNHRSTTVGSDFDLNTSIITAAAAAAAASVASSSLSNNINNSNNDLLNISSSSSSSNTGTGGVVKQHINKPPRKILPTSSKSQQQQQSNYEPVSITTDSKKTNSSVLLKSLSSSSSSSSTTAANTTTSLAASVATINDKSKCSGNDKSGNNNCQRSSREYETIETIQDAWKTLGLNDVKHIEHIKTPEDDLMNFIWQKVQQQQSSGDITNSDKSLAATTAYYDHLDFLSSNSKSNSAGYKTIVSVTSPSSIVLTAQNNSQNGQNSQSVLAKKKIPSPSSTTTATSSSVNDYELITNPDIQPFRVADDSHLGYGILRKPLIMTTAPSVTAATLSSSTSPQIMTTASISTTSETSLHSNDNSTTMVATASDRNDHNDNDLVISLANQQHQHYHLQHHHHIPYSHHHHHSHHLQQQQHRNDHNKNYAVVSKPKRV